LNRGRHLYSAGRPSHWVLAHILVWHVGVELGGAMAPLPLPFRPKSAYVQGGLAHNSLSTCKGNVPLLLCKHTAHTVHRKA